MRTIDIHAHLVPPSFLARIARGEFEGVGLRDDGEVRLLWGDRPSRPVFPALRDVTSRLDYLQRHDIDVQIVSNWAGSFGYSLPESSAADYCRAFNREISLVVAETGGALRAMATVPLQFPEQAAIVLVEALDRHGLHGVEIGTNIAGVQLDDPRFDPFWAVAAAREAPVVLHPINTVAPDRLGDYYLENFLGNPFDTTIAAARLMLGGVFDRFPALQVVLFHGGGYTLMAAGRIEHGQRKRPEPAAAHPAGHYLQHNLFVDTVVFTPETLDFIVGMMGSDRVLLGTDCPFDMGQDDAVAFVSENLPARKQGRILARNAIRLFSL